MKKLFIVGSGGFGREVLWLVHRVNKSAVLQTGASLWNIVGFIDDNETLHGTLQDGYPVLGGCEYLKNLSEEIYIVIAVGSTKIKKNVVENFSCCHNVHFATLIDPTVIISNRVEIGEGSIICAGTIITVDITIGKHVIINLNCTLGHDDVIDDYVTIYPNVNISGNVHVGQGAELGTGMQIIQGRNIGKQSIIGAGTVVVKDIPEKCTAVGNPAKLIKFFE